MPGSSATVGPVGSADVEASRFACRNAAVLCRVCGVSQASPIPVRFVSAWSGFAVRGQLSTSSGTPSRNASCMAGSSPRLCRRPSSSGVQSPNQSRLSTSSTTWAERAKTAGYPERFAQLALGHNSKAVHRAYAKKAQVTLPPLEEYEQKVVPFKPAKNASLSPEEQQAAQAVNS